VLESLRRSKIKLVLTRHRAGCRLHGGHLRASHRTRGRLPDDAGSGALNLTTAAAYAHLGAMPMVMITGQRRSGAAVRRVFQIVDIRRGHATAHQDGDADRLRASIPTLVRDAFRVAQQERPGPVHLECPRTSQPMKPLADIIPPTCRRASVAPAVAIERAAALIMAASRPLVMLGAAASRPQLAEPLSAFVRRCKIPFFNTQMGKGAVNAAPISNMGTAALSERDWVHEAIDQADLIISIGHDTVREASIPDGP